MKNNQRQQWEKYSNSIELEDIFNRYKDPHAFHVELARLVDNYCSQFESAVVAEVGCETGITLMLLKKAKRKIFLDYDQGILRKLGKFLNIIDSPADLVCEDMFNIQKISGNSCDIIFNSGVIEHYDESDRFKALTQYAKILRKGGYVIIAYPNHYSLFYKFAYVIRRRLGERYWPWPAEYSIRNLTNEMNAAGLKYEKTLLLDRSTLPKLYPNIYLVRSIVNLFTKIFPSERYLRVCVGKKISAP